MKTAVYFDINQTKIIDKPIPQLAENEVLLEVSYSGICGTDLAIIAGKHPRAPKMVVFGHEFIGRVAEINTVKETSLRKGDLAVVYPLLECQQCFVCRRGDTHICKNLKMIGIDYDGGMAQYAKVPLDRLLKIDQPEVSERLLALAEPVAVALHAIREAKVVPTQTIAIIGAGPIGLLIAYILHYQGFMPFSIVDINPNRLGLAARIGTIHPVNASEVDAAKAIVDFNNHNEVDCVFEVTGTKDGLETAFKALAPKGTLMIVGVHKQNREINLQNILYNEQTLKGVRVYTETDFKDAVNLLINKDFNPGFVITHVFSLNDIDKALQTIAAGGKVGKVLLDCSD
jgi:(R,R)-butanediol dehydrogenase/meso-butanediol dehydrogenase/diacetyl reductase